MAIAPADQAEHLSRARAKPRGYRAHRFRRPALVHEPVRLFEDRCIQEVRAAHVVTRQPNDAVGLDPFGGVVDAPPAAFRGFLLVEQAVFR